MTGKAGDAMFIKENNTLPTWLMPGTLGTVPGLATSLCPGDAIREAAVLSRPPELTAHCSSASCFPQGFDWVFVCFVFSLSLVSLAIFSTPFLHYHFPNTHKKTLPWLLCEAWADWAGKVAVVVVPCPLKLSSQDPDLGSFSH